MFSGKFYEIKLESVGGMGANILGEMLGNLGANYLQLQSQSFSSYGSEKRGSPVKSYIRWSKAFINVNSPITNPDILGIFYETLLSKKGSLSGVTDKTTVVINSGKQPSELAKYLKVKKIYAIDCDKISLESKARINVIMLGAIIKAIDFVSLETAENLVRDTLGKKYPKLLDINLEGLRRGYHETRYSEFEVEKYEYTYRSEQKWGYANAPIGGVNPQRGGTIVNDLSASRSGYIPIFIQERCINCAQCDITCPDMVYQFKEGIYKNKPWMINLGPDYHHCKGCLRCVEICPTEALVAGIEKDHRPLKSVRNLMLLVDELDYEAQGASSWITSESNSGLTKVDGGIK